MDTPIRVNATEIPAPAIASEMQFHQAATPEEAWTQAATALAIRALLTQEANRLNIAADPGAEENPEEARIRALLAQEITTPETDDSSCRRYFEANRKRFRGKDIYEAAKSYSPPPAMTHRRWPRPARQRKSY
jgi:peptidyl-prolyl cis-trans isomerase C